jgi:hypothetical protein
LLHCFIGPLRNARVVLLYLSPGLDDDDLKEAESATGRKWMIECRTGNQKLPNQKEHGAAWRWWVSRTPDFGSEEDIRSNVAILNVGAYHSNQSPNTCVLAALPSSRLSLDWAQSELFPQAIAGERVVICLRAARLWGRDIGDQGKTFGEALFAPRTTRAGHMLKLPLRKKIIAKAAAAIKSVR